MTFNGKEFVTFDCYGTLINWADGIKESFRKLIDEKELKISEEDLLQQYYEFEKEVEKTYMSYKDVLRLTVRKVLEAQGLNPTDEDCEILIKAIPTWQPFPEVKSTLEELKRRRYKLVILSNVDEDIIAKSIENIGVEFDGVITAEQVKSYKPNFGHWQEMLERFNTKTDKILHVGAGYYHDAIPAKKQGISAVLINRGNEPVIGNIKPDAEFDNLAPLTEILPDLNS